jgi:hypothetical protein
MWKFIDHIMRPNELVPDKSVLNYDNVFVIYTKLRDIDETFRELLQINILKKGLEEEKNSVTL